jgi:hypothetical protein
MGGICSTQGGRKEITDGLAEKPVKKKKGTT